VGASTVEFYLAQTEAAADAMQIKLPDGVLYLQRQPVLTREDLIEAAALVDKQGQNFVGLRFNEAGARKLNQISGQNIGKMLALVVERQLVAAPRISEPLNRGVLAFSVASAQEANELSSAIRGGAAAASAAGTTAATPLAPASSPR
jgi:preprotein translocase subunit SecD